MIPIKNQEIIRILREFADYYEEISDIRYKIYENAIVFIEELTEEISINNIPKCLPKSIREMIINYLTDHKIPKELIDIRVEYGNLLNKKCSNKEKHYTQRDHLKLTCDTLLGTFISEYPNTEYHILGSYRRGSQYCGDADILIISSTPNNVLSELIMTLSMSNEYEIISNINEIRLINKYTGFLIKIRACHHNEKGSFMIESTGSDSFNMKLRRIANKKGLRFLEYGLYDPITEILHTYDNEEKLFKDLGLDYIEPEDRTGGAACFHS